MLIHSINNLIHKIYSRLAEAAVILAILTPLTAACVSPGSASDSAANQGLPVLDVVATNSIVADWAVQVGGEHVRVFPLLPIGKDPHAFQPGAQDIARVADADLILTVGLGLEASWFSKLVKSAAADPLRLVPLGKAADPLEVQTPEASTESTHEADDQSPLDPHFWFDPLRVKLAVSEIARRLSAVDPAGEDVYRANAAAYSQQLDTLHEWALGQVSRIPSDRRLLVTSHDSFRYFAQRYGFRIIGAVVPGITTEREPSANELTDLIENISQAQAPAIFTETTLSDRLARTIANETGAKVVTQLYTGSLGPPGSGAETYLGMMQANVNAIVEALK